MARKPAFFKSISIVSLVGRIFFLDVIVGLFLGALIVDNPRRTPILYIAVPVVLVSNLLIILWKKRNPGSITLLLVYGAGLLWGIIWTSADFEWWKIPLLAVPSYLLYLSAQRFRRENDSKPFF